jgi:hypothetical protein
MRFLPLASAAAPGAVRAASAARRFGQADPNLECPQVAVAAVARALVELTKFVWAEAAESALGQA